MKSNLYFKSLKWVYNLKIILINYKFLDLRQDGLGEGKITGKYDGYLVVMLWVLEIYWIYQVL